MKKALLIIKDIHGNTETVEFEAENEIDARMNFDKDDEKLCRNKYVIIENVGYFTRQIVDVKIL